MSADELLRLLWDPTAPLPTVWPAGAAGAFLLFLVPVGGGIPLGVLIARDGGVGPALTALLYLASDMVIACFAEPWLTFLSWLGRRIPFLGRLGQRLARLSGGAGLRDGGARGPLGLVLVSFSTSPTMGRAAAAAAGHGFFSGWALAIAGDMLYFVLVMASTLWISGVLGDERLTIGAVLVGTWVLPTVIRRLRAARTSLPRRMPVSSPGIVPALAPASAPTPAPPTPTRPAQTGPAQTGPAQTGSAETRPAQTASTSRRRLARGGRAPRARGLHG
jgi:hypothetical protein